MPDQFLAQFNKLPAYLWDGILVALAIADGGRLNNRCGDGPIR